MWKIAPLIVLFVFLATGCGTHKPNTPIYTELPKMYKAVVAKQIAPPEITPGEDGVLRLTAYLASSQAMNHRCAGNFPIGTCEDIITFVAVAESADDQYDYVIKNVHTALVNAFESETSVAQKLVLYGDMLPLTEPWNEYVIGPDFEISAISYHHPAIKRNLVIFTDYEEGAMEAVAEQFTIKEIVLGIIGSIKGLFTGALAF